MQKKQEDSKGRHWTRVKGRRCLISSGETTITGKGSGSGGRNMELALSFAMEIEGIDGITLSPILTRLF